MLCAYAGAILIAICVSTFIATAVCSALALGTEDRVRTPLGGDAPGVFVQATAAEAYTGRLEPVDGARLFEPGHSFACGGLKISSRSTWGHSKGGISYLIEGLEKPLAVVGDAVFAGSMGGGSVSYADALRTNREELLSLPAETVLCPGHGPLTTVAEERLHNPFFALGK